MPQEMINVSVNDIRYAESILLPEGKTFDEERVSFIRNFDTIDLQAVPGSGKTTALLAKLLILETKLDYLNNRGVLILSHTNTAVDEIKKKIGKHCPKLFSYPNFIGTIQSFVDQFLAIPYYHIQYGRKIIRIDNEIYKESISKFSTINLKGFTIQEANNAKYFIRSNEGLLYKYRLLFEDGSLRILSGQNKPPLSISKPRKSQNRQDFSAEEKDKIRRWMIALKVKMLSKGILHFDDAYLLAEIYLYKYPKIKKILQERFCFVFIDEMQDVDSHQYNLLEKIFYDNSNSTSKYQRIGDKNQAIYAGEVSLNEIWLFRDNGKTININGSHRLSKNIAELVNCFALSREGDFHIVGKNDNCNLKPHLLTYNIENIKQVIPEFSKLIDSYIKSGEILVNTRNKYKVIGWTKEKTNEINKLAIKSYFDNLITENSTQKIDYENLDSYLIVFNKEKKTFKQIRINILNAMIKILRLEGAYYSTNTLLNYIETNHPEEYISLKRNLYNWSFNIIKGKLTEVYFSIKTYIPFFLQLFNKSIQLSYGFINSTSANINTQNNQQDKNSINKVNFHGFDIDISTIHSVKGETHTATLYLETFYQNGNDNYESQRLSDQFKFINFNKTRKYHMQSSKMVYVGFSRPTNLLCFAVSKDRFDSHLNDIDLEKWTIIDL